MWPPVPPPAMTTLTPITASTPAAVPDPLGLLDRDTLLRPRPARPRHRPASCPVAEPEPAHQPAPCARAGHRQRTAAPGSDRANAMSMPSAAMVTISEDTPAEISGSGTPVIGSRP